CTSFKRRIRLERSPDSYTAVSNSAYEPLAYIELVKLYEAERTDFRPGVLHSIHSQLGKYFATTEYRFAALTPAAVNLSFDSLAILSTSDSVVNRVIGKIRRPAGRPPTPRSSISTQLSCRIRNSSTAFR